MRPYVAANPLAVVIEALRSVLFAGELPSWRALGAAFAVALVAAWAGLAWFERTRPGFADVL